MGVYALKIPLHSLFIVASVVLQASSFIPNDHNAFCRRRRQRSVSLPLSSRDGREHDATLPTLPSYLNESGIDAGLQEVILSVADACADISRRLERLPIDVAFASEGSDDLLLSGGGFNVQGEKQKGMDVVANDIFIRTVRGAVAAMASEEEEAIIFGEQEGREGAMCYEVAFDPLDGSSNLDSGIPTGTIFGIAPFNESAPFSSSGRSLVAAGYSVYSSSLDFVVSLGPSGSMGAAGFTFDPTMKQQHRNANRFLLTRPSMVCPSRGPFYSLNDGREPDWPEGLRRWIHDAKRGLTPSGTVFSARYVCSLCADVHRTLLKGGWAGNPRPHLRLLYEAAPLAHVAEACQGRGSDGEQNILDIVPTGLHDRVHTFIGSADDVLELEAYGDVQQGSKTYDS